MREKNCARDSSTFALIFAIISIRIIAGLPTDSDTSCNNNRGDCKHITDCPEILKNYHLIYKTVKYCDEFNGIVCCDKPRKKIIEVDNTKKFQRECNVFSDIRGPCASTPFIVNGTKAEPREFPFMALIGLEKKEPPKWICGGTLISRDYVLTAAHCLVTSIQNPVYIVRLGELDYNSTTDDAQPQDFFVKNSVIHPGYYDNEEQHNDIALMQLDREAILNAYVMPACLPVSNGNEFQLVTATGWGQTKQSGPSSSHLLKVLLNRFDDEQCENILQDNQINTKTQVCAGSFNTTGDTCQGDSGGPIFVQHPVHRCMRQIIGVTSFGGICGSMNLPSIYTRVHLFTDWIESIVWRL